MGRYNDALYVRMVSGTEPKQTRDEYGDLVDNTDVQETLDYVGMCREEPSSGNSVIEETDGTTLVYTSEVFMPADTPAVENNSSVEIYNAAGVLQVKGKVLRYKKYKHYAKLWI